jgi:hypothetical protein
MSHTNRLALCRAVTIQPLSAEQADEYFARVGEKVASLRVAFQNDLVLRELATTPLMLNILILTYQGSSLEEICGDASAEVRQRQIFALYTQRMLRRRNAQSRYEPQQTIHWLSYLAQQMKRQSQTVFYIEHMQPSWLPSGWVQQIYTYLGVRLPGILMGILVSLTLNFYFLFLFSISKFVAGLVSLGLVGGLLGGLLSRKHAVPVVTIEMTSSRKGFRRGLIIRGVTVLGTGVLIGVVAGLVTASTVGLDTLTTGVIYGLGTILLTLLVRPGIHAESSNRATDISQRSRWYTFLRSQHVKNGWLVGGIIGLCHGLNVGLSMALSELTNGGLNSVLSNIRSILTTILALGLIFGLLFGLTTVIVSLILADRSGSIQPIERLSWSWKSLGRSLISTKHLKNVLYLGLIIVLLGGLVIVLVLFISSSPPPGYVVSMMLRGLLGLVLGITVVYWVLFGLVRGVTGEQLDEQRRVVPNYGIHRSARNGLLFGFVGGGIFLLICRLGVILFLVLFFGLASVLQIGPSQLRPALLLQNTGPRFFLFPALVFSFASCLISGLLTGWLACIRHYILRWLLWRNGSIPRNYSGFLDYAAERILLRKAGGGYIFIHRLLLDYFASLETPSSEEVPAASAK